MNKKMKRNLTSAGIVAGMAITIMAAAYAEGNRSSQIDKARNVEPAAQGRSMEGSMGMAPGNVSTAMPRSAASHTENGPTGTSLTKSGATVGLGGSGGDVRGNQAVTGQPATR